MCVCMYVPSILAFLVKNSLELKPDSFKYRKSKRWMSLNDFVFDLAGKSRVCQARSLIKSSVQSSHFSLNQSTVRAKDKMVYPGLF